MIVKIFAILLALTVPARAEPISFTVAAISAISSAVSAVSGLVGGFSGLIAFLSSPIGALVLGVGIALVSSMFIRKPQAPSAEAGKVNVRIPEAERWLACGRVRMGGAVVFAEFDDAGNFWFIVIHSDSILTSVIQYIFDDEPITVDAQGDVTTNAFVLTGGNNTYDQDDEAAGDAKKIIWSVYTTTYSAADPTPTPIQALKTAFPTKWTNDHKLVGTTYSVIKCRPLDIEHRYKAYKWRGPIGVGEPAVSIVGRWSNVYDPRDGIYKPSSNSALIWAWFRTHPYGRNKPFDSINWTMVAAQANICDEFVVDIDGNSNRRYECGIAIPDSKERNEAEQEILMTCDAQLVFDDDGKCWPRVGYHYLPSLRLVRNRDIVAMESVEARDGESLTQGVIVRYIEPAAQYAAQPSAPWINPLYYDAASSPKYLTVDALGIQNHNQAMRLAKSIGYRSQPEHKLLPTVGLRGLKARQERIVNLQYDNTFSGEYEIVTPVEVDQVGVFCGFGVVPVDADRWNLLAGEEKSKPVFHTSKSVVSLALPTNVLIKFKNNRIEATFDPTPRPDWSYEFECQEVAGAPVENNWLRMIVQIENSFAYSGGVVTNTDYYVRWRTRSSSGRVSDWISPIPTVNTTLLTLTGTPVTTGTVGIAYGGFTIGVTGGKTPYIFSDIFGRLPDGISINSATGEISGTPTVAGIFADIILRVYDNNNAFNDFPTFTITIS